MGVIPLSPLDLSLAALLIVFLAATSRRARLGVERQLVIAAARTVVQLLLVGVVLKAIFSHVHLGWISLMALVMLLAAGWEVMSRQKRRFSGWWGFGTGTTAMFVSSFAVAVIALTVIVQPAPWYAPQYAIPLLGMLLGNTMNGVALGINSLTDAAWQQRAILEQRLMLGETRSEAIADIRRDAMRTGLIPVINSMAAAGIVSLPGMMTGQILAGADPAHAVRYQAVIVFMIASAIALSTLSVVLLAFSRLFDSEHRLRWDLIGKART